MDAGNGRKLGWEVEASRGLVFHGPGPSPYPETKPEVALPCCSLGPARAHCRLCARIPLRLPPASLSPAPPSGAQPEHRSPPCGSEDPAPQPRHSPRPGQDAGLQRAPPSAPAPQAVWTLSEVCCWEVTVPFCPLNPLRWQHTGRVTRLGHVPAPGEGQRCGVKLPGKRCPHRAVGQVPVQQNAL